MRNVHFEARQTGGGFRKLISSAAELYIISTVYTGLPRRGCAELFVGIPLFFYADLTLPLVNPPIERGLLSNSFLSLLAVARESTSGHMRAA